MQLLLRRCLPLAVALALLAVTPQVRAAIIFDNGGIGPPLTGGANFSQGSNRIADNFTLAGANTIRSIQFWGSHWSSGALPTPDAFQIIVYGDAAGLPDVGNVIGVSGLNLISRIDTGFDHNNNGSADILEYTMDLASAIAIPDTNQYWLSVHQTGSPNGTNFAWQRVTGPLGPNARSNDFGVTWFSGAGDDAWNISNTSALATVPEPASIAVWSAMAGLGLLMRRRRLRS